MTLDYEKSPPTNSTHDHVYTTLLGVLAFLLVLGIVSLLHVRHMSQLRGDPAEALLFPAAIEACYVVAILIGLVIRVVFPAYRRWPTIGLNIILLLCFPLGTALGFYGLRRVDKNLPRSSI